MVGPNDDKDDNDQDYADDVPFDPEWGERGPDVDLSDNNPDIPSSS